MIRRPEAWAKTPRTLKEALAMKAKRPKYGNRPTVVDGIRFDSAKEARRWSELRMLEKAGRIANLQRQVSFRLHVPVIGLDVRREVGRITFDFFYWKEAGERVYEDVKSPATRKNTAYRLRKRMFETEYSATILET